MVAPLYNVQLLGILRLFRFYFFRVFVCGVSAFISFAFFAVCGCSAVFFAEIRLFEGKKSVFAQQQDVEKWCQNNRMNLTMEPKRETYICIYVYIYEQHQVHP